LKELNGWLDISFSFMGCRIMDDSSNQMSHFSYF
jgi:hypothetical protein